MLEIGIHFKTFFFRNKVITSPKISRCLHCRQRLKPPLHFLSKMHLSFAPFFVEQSGKPAMLNSENKIKKYSNGAIRILKDSRYA